MDPNITISAAVPESYNITSTLENWDTQYKRFEGQIDSFNEFVEINEHSEKPELQMQKIQKLFEIVNDSLKHLKTLTKQIDERREELNKKSCCSRNGYCYRLLTGSRMYIRSTEFLSIAVSLYQSNTVLRSIATVCLGVSFFIDVGTTIRKKQLKREREEMQKLLTRNQEKVRQVRQFRTFLRELRTLQQIGIENLRGLTSRTDKDHEMQTTRVQPQHIAERMKKCFEKFDELVLVNRTDAAYDTIVSIIAKALPDGDPLRKALEVVPAKITASPISSYKEIEKSTLPGSELSEELFLRKCKMDPIDHKEKNEIDHKGNSSWGDIEGGSGDDDMGTNVIYQMDRVPKHMRYRLIMMQHKTVKA